MFEELDQLDKVDHPVLVRDRYRLQQIRPRHQNEPESGEEPGRWYFELDFVSGWGLKKY